MPRLGRSCDDCRSCPRAGGRWRVVPFGLAQVVGGAAVWMELNLGAQLPSRSFNRLLTIRRLSPDDSKQAPPPFSNVVGEVRQLEQVHGGCRQDSLDQHVLPTAPLRSIDPVSDLDICDDKPHVLFRLPGPKRRRALVSTLWSESPS